MKQMMKVNLLGLLMGLALPEFIGFLLYRRPFNADWMPIVNFIIGFVTIVVSLYLIFFNGRNFGMKGRREKLISSLLIFVLALFVMYQGFIIYIQYSIRHGIGF